MSFIQSSDKPPTVESLAFTQPSKHCLQPFWPKTESVEQLTSWYVSAFTIYELNKEVSKIEDITAFLNIINKL